MRQGLGVRNLHNSSTRWAAVALLVLGIAPGCAGLPLLDWKAAKIQTADAKNPAIEILAIWQPTEGPGAKGVPTRGFAGQIFFFTQGQPAPAKVEGAVRIYLFDDRGTVAEQAKPIHQYDFDRQAWAAHMRPSTIGASYGIFIPYPRDDFHQSSCALRIRFTPAAGPTIYSPMSTIVLPGPMTKTSGLDMAAVTRPDSPRISNHDGASTTTLNPGSGVDPKQILQMRAAANAANPSVGNNATNVSAPAAAAERPSVPQAPARITLAPAQAEDDAEAADTTTSASSLRSDQLVAPGSSGRIKLLSAESDAADSGEGVEQAIHTSSPSNSQSGWSRQHPLAD